MVFLCQVTQLPYPIKAKPLGKFRYFQKVEYYPAENHFNFFNYLFLEGGMEGYWRPLQPNADDDGNAAASHHGSAQDDAGIWPPSLWIRFLTLVLSQDPETKKEMEEMQAKMNVQNVPEMSEMITNLFGGGAPAPKKKAGGGALSTVRARRQ